MDANGIHDVEINWRAFKPGMVKLDGREIAVTKVSFEAEVDGLSLVTMTFHANINASVSGKTCEKVEPVKSLRSNSLL